MYFSKNKISVNKKAERTIAKFIQLLFMGKGMFYDLC